MYITGEGEPYRPDLILWLELPAGFVVGTEVLHPREPVARFAAALRNAMQRPMVGPPRRPDRVRVADRELAEAVRAELGDAARVEVAPTPELDAVLRNMRDSFPADAGDELESYFEDGRVPPAVVADLFAAAAALYPLAPWQQADDSQALRVDIPRLDVHGACLSIIGALGESIGLLLFPSLAAFEAFVDAPERMRRGAPVDLGGFCLSLTFERGAEIPPAMWREVSAHGWPVAGADAYPHVVMRDRDGLIRPLAERDVRVMAAIARSLTALCVRHGDLWSDAASAPICESYDDGDGLEVRFTLPYHAGHLFPANDPAPAGGRPRAARNAPCPCGSGRKYRKCHLDADTAAARAENVEDGRLVSRMLEWAVRRFGTACVAVLAEAEADPAAAQIVVPWCAYHAEAAGVRIAEHFRAANAATLSPAERDWLDAQLQSWLSIWEVSGIEPDAGVHVTDLLTGDTRYVVERTASRTLVERHAVLARVVDHAGTSTFCGLAPRALSPLQADAVVQRVRARLRVRGPVRHARLRGDAIGRYLLARWRDAVDAATARAEAPPQLSNTDGDALLFTTDHYAVDAAARVRLEQRLLDLGAVAADDTDAGERRYDVIRPHPSDPDQSTIIGHLRLTDTALAVETNSIARADALRRRIETVCGWLLRHRLREHADPRAALARGAATPKTTPATALDPAETTRIERELKERHYRRWLDESIPALDGETPRAAVRTAAGRRRVDVLLRDIEHHESHLPPEARIDLAPLRRELGLDA